MKKILVIGANGFMGQALCNALQSNYEVIALDIYFDEHMYNNELINCVQCNCNDIDAYQSYVIQADVIFYLMCTVTPHEGLNNLCNEIDDNLHPLIKLMDYIVMHKLKTRLIFVSSGGTIYGESSEKNSISHKENPICSYGTLKLIQEEYIKLYGRIYNLDYLIVRVANLYGIGQKQERKQGIIPILIDSLINNHPVTLYGNTIRDYIYMDDVIDCYEKLIDYSGDNRIFNIGTGEGTSLSSLIEVIERICERKFNNISIREDRRQCDVVYSVLDISETKNALYWSPEISLEKGISLIVDRMRKQDAIF